ncbi:MAG TPA: NAD-glutamate dehydrogenase, partial [Rhizomicrobium sp.]|nr:NAD-glutamate dehydrogenase [Rhizomicrobium sp.]
MTPKNAVAAAADPADAAVQAHEDEKIAAKLTKAGAAALGNAAPGLAAFYELFYRNAPPDDITRYNAEALAALAASVFKRCAHRKHGESYVELFSPHAENKDFTRNEMVLVAINDDMPFLFDSLIAETNAHGVRVRAVFHPVVPLGEKADGKLEKESVIALVIDPVADEETRKALVDGAKAVFAQVHLAVRDWPQMQTHLKDTIADLKKHPPKVPDDELQESIAFLDWLSNNHFTFLGCRDYRYSDKDGGRHDAVEESGLGVLSDSAQRVIHRGEDRGLLSDEARDYLKQPTPLIITKSNDRSVIHRRVKMDYVGVKMFDGNGKLTGEHRFVGLFTSGAYSRRPTDIPLLRLKVKRVKERAGLASDSHDGKSLSHILDTFPRDELFQISDDELFAEALGILRLGERPKVRVFLRIDRFDRFVSALVFVPRDRYDTEAREKIHAILAKAFNGRMTAANPMLDDSALARVHYIVGRNEGPRPVVDVHALEGEIKAAIRTWEDGFSSALAQTHGEADGQRVFQLASSAFPARYRDAFAPDEAVRDLDELHALAKDARGLAVKARAYRHADDAHAVLRLKLYVLGNVVPLSASMPIFENLGLRVIAEDSYPVSLKTQDGWAGDAAVLDFLMERGDGASADLEEIKQPLEDAFHAIIEGRAESDGFNKLVIGAELDWRDVTILRTVAKFLRQAGIAFSQEYMELALSRNPDIAQKLVELFHVLNDPHAKDREKHGEELRKKIDGALNDVQSLDDDRIIRRMRNVIDCTLRTNYWQRDRDGETKPYLSIKLKSQELDELPAPRPFVEIFVYSPEMEGVHLRFGKVARGGIRWSDRREDFRTEILGLVKAQQVKNAVIVPVGSKGGFYPKRMPLNPTREESQTIGVSAYKVLINALLDLTDNIRPDGSIEAPKDVLRHDGDDPYLVVAADKGTATFSDIANGIAEDHGFWLGDAFASGGSHGYDHKKMGITARGAWVAVERHFREMGRNTQTEEFTVVGVGDMSGDVFGNGMLLSKKIKLLAAFDHRHIFIDPTPDTEASWNERQRMFDLPRSSWEDYNKTLISKGGGVYPRTLKEIPVSPEVKQITGLSKDKIAPAELIKALLKSDVDLLWFGGIGTYIKASTQNNLDVGDRANDALRVNGGEICAKVVGEGANLGCTQLGRVEYALKGGRINTDAIDNSAGVDTSDHEVNLKILFSGPMRRGEITQESRDKLLTAMTDDVAAHVLRDNYDQTLALSVAQARGPRDLDAQGRFMRDLERRGKLDRAVEYLPDDEGLRARGQESRGLLRPELAVLLAYAKLDLDAELVASEVPDDPYFASELAGYFPSAAVERFPDEMIHHRLRREIIVTVLANKIVNLAGPVFMHRLKEVSSTTAPRVARAFVVAEGAFGLEALKARIDALDYKVPAEVQTGMYADIAELLRRMGLWFLANVPANADLTETVALYRGGVEALRGTFSTLVSPYEMDATMNRIKELEDAGVPHDLADDIAALGLWSTSPEIAQL